MCVLRYCRSEYSLFVVFKCVQPVFVLIDVFDKQITAVENIRSLRREVVVRGDKNCFFRAVALGRDETGDEKHKEISGSSTSLFQKDPKVFELPLLAIFNYKQSCCGFFNTNIFYLDFFG